MNNTKKLLRKMIVEIIQEDSRGNIRKLVGLSKETTDYLHGEFKKNSFIAALLVRKAFESNDENIAGEENIDHFFDDYLELGGDYFYNIMSVLSHYNVKPKDIDEMTFEQITSYIDELSNKSINVDQLRGRAILTFNDGSFWIKLEDDECGEDGIMMKHCGNDPATQTALSGGIYSLKDQFGKPKVTATITDGIFSQVASKGNNFPKENYWEQIAQLINTLNAEFNDGVRNSLNYADFIAFYDENFKVL